VTAARTHDAIVIGAGGMGSAACYQLAKRGRRVLGLERFGIPNEMGSSHGHTLIIRYAQTDVRYVSLVRWALELWRALEAATGECLLHVTGSIEGGTPGGELFDQVHASLSEAAVPFEVLTRAEANARFPGYGLPADADVAYQANSGFVVPQHCTLDLTETDPGRQWTRRTPIMPPAVDQT
jgi:sarcosine oxidase